ncbi:glycosyltransferase [Candidatus Parcubacteria bacterium]|nr:MAG: glycosyltransferase [Candidatus Parcubacteria bacterium]
MTTQTKMPPMKSGRFTDGTRVQSMTVVFISPLFFGDSSGAAIYYRLLAKYVSDKGCIVSVISDKEMGDFDGQYYDLFPKRCGQNKKFPRDVYVYGVQNLKYLLIPKILHREQPNALLVHSSFYNHPGIFANAMNKVRNRFPELKMVLDVRDRMMSPEQVKSLAIYDKIIACSENVLADLQSKGLSKSKIIHIPVLQEKLSVDLSGLPKLLAGLGIRQPYIYYAGLVKEAKGVDLLLDTYVNHIRRRNPELSLVISGLMKTRNSRIISQLKSEGVRYIGNRCRSEVLQLIAGSSACVHLSPNEGLPRFCLEVLALRKPIVLPPNIPEFERYCADCVVPSSEPAEIAQKILTIYTDAKAPIYPIEMHFPESVLSKYLKVLGLAD